MTPIVSSVANYLLNTLWQVPLLFAVAWLLARAARRIGPLAEHRVWTGTLLLQVALPACSLPVLGTALHDLWLRLFDGAESTKGTVAVTLGAAKPIASGGLTLPGLRIALAIYACVTAYLAARFVWQWFRLRPLGTDLQNVSLRPAEEAFFTACLRHWRIHDVQMASSPAVQAPLTFGLRRPMLLLPAGFAGRVPGPQLQATLGHELAHVRRRDYAKHLLYRAVSLPVAYHPLLWSTLARVTETRELVCDAMAAEVLGDRKQFARSLLELASLLIDAEPVPSHAIGMFDANRFERRIVMLHQKEVKASRGLRVGIVALSAVAALTTCASAVALRLHVDTPPAAESTASKTAHVDPSVMAGQVINKVHPKYPEEAKKAKISGAVVMSAIISKEGTVENLQVVSGPEELRASALDAVRQWTYKPYLLNGDPTEVETTITVTYSFSE